MLGSSLFLALPASHARLGSLLPQRCQRAARGVGILWSWHATNRAGGASEQAGRGDPRDAAAVANRCCQATGVGRKRPEGQREAIRISNTFEAVILESSWLASHSVAQGRTWAPGSKRGKVQRQPSHCYSKLSLRVYGWLYKVCIHLALQTLSGRWLQSALAEAPEDRAWASSNPVLRSKKKGGTQASLQQKGFRSLGCRGIRFRVYN